MWPFAASYKNPSRACVTKSEEILARRRRRAV
jgi:hypothetical protein